MLGLDQNRLLLLGRVDAQSVDSFDDVGGRGRVPLEVPISSVSVSSLVENELFFGEDRGGGRRDRDSRGSEGGGRVGLGGGFDCRDSRGDGFLGLLDERLVFGVTGEESGFHAVVKGAGETAGRSALEELVESSVDRSESLDDVVNDRGGDLSLDSSGEEFGDELVENVVLGGSDSDGESVDVALDVEKSSLEGLVGSALEFPDDLDSDSGSLRKIDVGDTVVFDSGHSLSSVKEFDILEEGSDVIGFHNDLGVVLGFVAGESLDRDGGVGLGSEVDELGKEVTDVQEETFDGEVVLGVRSLDLGDREVRELLAENGDKDLLELSEGLLHDKKVGSAVGIEGEISAELLELLGEILGDGVVLDVVEDDSNLIEDVGEVESILSLEQISASLDELSSISGSGGVVEKLRVLGGLESVVSKIPVEGLDLGVVLHRVK